MVVGRSFFVLFSFQQYTRRLLIHVNRNVHVNGTPKYYNNTIVVFTYEEVLLKRTLDYLTFRILYAAIRSDVLHPFIHTYISIVYCIIHMYNRR